MQELELNYPTMKGKDYSKKEEHLLCHLFIIACKLMCTNGLRHPGILCLLVQLVIQEPVSSGVRKWSCSNRKRQRLSSQHQRECIQLGVHYATDMCNVLYRNMALVRLKNQTRNHGHPLLQEQPCPTIRTLSYQVLSQQSILSVLSPFSSFHSAICPLNDFQTCSELSFSFNVAKF